MEAGDANAEQNAVAGPEQPGMDVDNAASLDYWTQVYRDFVDFIPTLVTGLIVLAAFWLVALALRYLTQRFAATKMMDRDIVRFLGKLVYFGVIAFGIITALGTLGIDVRALVAGLGLTGFAVGFALKDVISNVLAGIMVLMYQTVSRGDHIKVSGFEGRVAKVTMRYTELDEIEGSNRIYLPNSMLFTNALVVIGRGAEGKVAHPDQQHVESDQAE